MKRIIFIGSSRSGKTTLSNALLGESLKYKKTQAVEVLGNAILDTPGEYLERSQMRGFLSVIATEAEIIGMVVSASEERSMFPPYFAGQFAKPVIGVITKIDLADEKKLEIAEARLKLAGAQKIFKVSSFTAEGLAELKAFLE